MFYGRVLWSSSLINISDVLTDYNISLTVLTSRKSDINTHFFYEQHFYKQRQAETGEELSKS